MDRKRRAMWERAFAKQERGEEVAEHYELLEPGIFDGLSKRDALEEARCVVRYWLHGQDTEPIPWRWEREAENWLEMGKTWGPERQAEKLRNMIEASRHDADYWDALNWLVVLLRAREEPMPDDLIDWTMEVHKAQIRDLRQQDEGDYLKEPPRLPSNKGRPRYAMDNRNMWFAWTYELLAYLGLEESLRYRAIADVRELDVHTVKDAVAAWIQHDGRLPAPWQCWPHRT